MLMPLFYREIPWNSTPSGGESLRVVPRLNLQIVRRNRCTQPCICDELRPIDPQTLLNSTLVSGRNCKICGLFVKQEDVVMRVFWCLSGRCRTKVGSRAGCLSGKNGRSVLRSAARGEVLKKRV